MRKLFFILLAWFPLLSVFASEMDNEVSYIYLKNALLTEDKDLSLSFIQKAYEFNSKSSDVLYLLALNLPNLDYQNRLSYLEKAVELNTWVIFNINEALSLYWDLLISSQDYKRVIAYAASYKDLVQETPDLLYPYMLVMRELEMKKPLDEMVDLAWGRYSNDPRFWEFFIAREGYFISFYSFLEEINIIPIDILPSLLENLPKEEALRKAYLSLFEAKNQETIFYAFLTLEGLYNPEDFLTLLKEKKDLFDLDLHKKLYDFFKGDVKESYKEWLSQVSGEFFWRDPQSILINNFLKVSKGELVEWSYKGKNFNDISLFFENKKPTRFKGTNLVSLDYGNSYPFVESISLEENEIITLEKTSFSFPLFNESWVYKKEPKIFIPLEETFSKVNLNIEESQLIPYLIKKEKFDNSGNPIYQANYLNGNLLRKAYKTKETLSYFNFLEFYEKDKLTSSLWDIQGNGVFDIMVVYPEENKTYILVDFDNDGQVDYIYYVNKLLKSDILEVMSNTEVDHIFIQEKIKSLEGISIPIDSPEALEWKYIPKFPLESGYKA